MIAKQAKKINTKLSILSKNATLYDYLLEYKLYPQNADYNGNSYIAIFILDGYFSTRKGIEYYNDIIARFMLSMPELNLYFQSERVKSDENTIHLSQLQNLKSIPVIKTNFNFNRADVTFFADDYVFWALKAYFEFLIRVNAYTYDKLEQYAIANFKDKAKDFSTLKAKCRSIFNWYLERDFKTTEKKYQRILSDKEWIMTRKENMTKINKERADKKRNDILMLVTSMFKDEYKLKNGDWNKSKISKELRINIQTVRKHIKDLQNENIIS